MTHRKTAELAIAGGRVVAPGGTIDANVIVRDGVISAVGGSADTGARLDASGCYVLPGGVDPHSHILANATMATIGGCSGGTTTVLSFTLPREDERPSQAFVRARDELLSDIAVDVGLHAAIWAPDRCDRSELRRLRAMGVAGIKLFLAYPELGMMVSDRRLYEILRDCTELGLLVQVHCENGGVIAARTAELLADGRRDARGFVDVRPPDVEEEAVARAIAIAAMAGAPLYLVHLSTGKSLAHVRAARASGQHVFAEACTHHLALDASRYAGPDPERYLVAPPLRDSMHVAAVWAALADGTLDAVGSDHIEAPYPSDGVGVFTELSYGLPGLELRVPLTLSLGRARGVPMERLAWLLSTGPARAFGLHPRKGTIMPGADADLVVWDPEATWTVRPEALHDGLADSPYAGLVVHGRIRHVVRDGQLAIRDGVCVTAQQGSYLPTARDRTLTESC